jgi:hypothetical protein
MPKVPPVDGARDVDTGICAIIPVIRNGYEYTYGGYEWVATHREVYFNSDRGRWADQSCYWCSKPLHRYGSAPNPVEIDHLDNNPLNNDEENLIASCRDCNLFRGKLDKWVSRMPPARFLELMEVIRDNWERVSG